MLVPISIKFNYTGAQKRTKCNYKHITNSHSIKSWWIKYIMLNLLKIHNYLFKIYYLEMITDY